MGIHQLDTRPGGRLDATLDPVNPEALLYERRNPSTNVWTLHAWVFKPNPGGMFDPWNTRVSC
jgi:hypothetical protein